MHIGWCPGDVAADQVSHQLRRWLTPHGNLSLDDASVGIFVTSHIDASLALFFSFLTGNSGGLLRRSVVGNAFEWEPVKIPYDSLNSAELARRRCWKSTSRERLPNSILRIP